MRCEDAQTTKLRKNLVGDASDPQIDKHRAKIKSGGPSRIKVGYFLHLVPTEASLGSPPTV